ncbi:cytidyltransferase [Tissierella sp. MSJ-40]|uniref:nicotinate-nucleotide adenylyltransferase n=1 Tax=Tissierella simiarum TaxID=2841534 RepID=A0ABS6E532_9FIRM|nr:cytidyltransferase [Tissierella simiarum]MBU5437936.1 cytidyltransferase [Tissierella simiarum]
MDELNKDYLYQFKDSIIQYIDSEQFESLLEGIIKDKLFSAFSLMDLFYDYFKLFDPISYEDWMETIYNWIVFKSFPHKNKFNYNKELIPLYELYLNLLRAFISYESLYKKDTFISNHPLSFLTEEEENKLQFPKEYFTFKKTFDEYYIYELMYLNMAITKHNTLLHIVGVNYLSLYIGRQLYELGLPVDLGVIVGASLGHDIGKYGVLKEDIERVPYLHYYYTEQWFRKFNMDRIGHIATNHSTWDLELENLPIESLILIYADFRVKNHLINNEYKIHIYTLDEAFDVVLSKLDNVDEEKENRYKKVYKKLKDFEDFMKNLGVDTTLKNISKTTTRKPYALMDSQEVVNNIKYSAINHNVNLMAKLVGNTSFNNILEMARGEYNWRKLRLYLQIFREYSTYLTQKQKITTLYFLSDLLLHKEEDIRKESAELIGLLIGKFDEEYRKEIPKSAVLNNGDSTSQKLLDKFLNNLLYPNHKIADSQKEWLYNLKIIIKSLFENGHESYYLKYFDTIYKYYSKYTTFTSIAQFYLSQTINYIPINHLNEERLLNLYFYILSLLNSNNLEIRLSTLDTINEILNKIDNNSIFIDSIKNWLLSNTNKSSTPAENYLKYMIGIKVGLSKENLLIFEKNYKEDRNNITDIFLKNLKTATEWMNKKVNIDILYDQVVSNPSTKCFHTSMHFCNLLKVSAVERVRNYAGETLLNIFPLLSLEERNDVAIELLRALEMESYQFTKFIPSYLGQLLLYLPPTELDEIIDDFEMKIKVSTTQIIFLLLNTIGVCIENYPDYMYRFKEKKSVYKNRLTRLLGLLLIAMSSYNHEVNNESFRIISSKIFNSNKLSLENKYVIFKKISKKVLMLITRKEDDEFLFYNNAASLNHIYRFISDYEFYFNSINFDKNKNIAFFPGTFDPFSLSHKEIAIEIRDKGFQVYLAVDEFSWSKRTEPHSLRRNIINMSIANEENIYLFPSEIPINISNPKDLYKLKSIFPNKEVYIVVGTDVLINASAYKKDSYLLEFSHIIFDRKSYLSKNDDEKLLEVSLNNIEGEVLRLSLPPQYEDISSSQIRQYIDTNRDISRLIDPLAQEYIYDYGLYLKEPQYKTLFETKTIEVEVLRNFDDNIIEYLNSNFSENLNVESLKNLRKKLSYRLLLLKDVENKKLLGISTFYWVRNSMLFDEFKNTDITEYIRKNTKGRTVLISGIHAMNDDEHLIEIILNETLSISINRDYNYALYNNTLTKKKNLLVEEQLLLQGFIKTKFLHEDNPLFLVDMNNPSTLNLDLENMLKPPFNNNLKILEVVHSTRKNLKKAISSLYPGELLITYNRDMIYSKLIQKICDNNEVSTSQLSKRQLGPNMCVPFGSILNSSIIPNTITKTLHTEKIFKPDILNFTIGSYPYYLSLENQSRVLKSFDKPIILVDDLLHKGYRINVVEPILKNNHVEIKKIIVGILSSRGKEIGEIRNIPVDSAYFVPNLKLWFNESSQYPFIGGDMVERNTMESYLIPSVNLILPYVSPRFIKNTTNEAIYNLSETCLINTFNIFKAIEDIYQQINEKNLNLKSLREVFLSPRHPYMDKNINLNKNIKPSTYVEIDLEYLKRLENIIKR